MRFEQPRVAKPGSDPVIMVSEEFDDWLDQQQLSLAFSTYQSGHVYFLGLHDDGRLNAYGLKVPQCQGLWSGGEVMWIAGRYHLYCLNGVSPPANASSASTGLVHYSLRSMHCIGDLDAHSVAVDRQGRVLFVNTAFGCLAAITPGANFRPLYKPPFLSELVSEDRCHLNGLALENGHARYLTAVSRSNVLDGWRDQRRDGGVIIDIGRDEVVVQGLSMPHSPCMFNGKLWFLNAGTGEICIAEPESGKITPVAFCPGFARGLVFHGHYAIVGLSKPRHDFTFDGLVLDERLQENGTVPRCGLMVLDTRSGRFVHWLRLEGTITELFDVVTLPGVRRVVAAPLPVQNYVPKDISFEALPKKTPRISVVVK